MKVLVTGAGGPAGVSLVRLLEENGFSVRVLAEPGLEPDLGERRSIELYPGTVHDMESIVNALKGVQVVFHCESSSEFSPPRSERSFERNFGGTRNLLICMSRCGTEELVHMGTAFAFRPGTADEPGTEEENCGNTDLELTCLESKRMAQDLVLRYNETGRIRCIVVSPSLVLGRSTERLSPSSMLVDYVAGGGRYYPPGGTGIAGAQDVARAMLKALGRGRPGSCYIISSANLKYRELFSGIAAELGVPPPAGKLRFTTARRAFRKLSRRTPRGRLPLNRELLEFLEEDRFYSGVRAEEELGLTWSSSQRIIREACGGRGDGPDR